MTVEAGHWKSPESLPDATRLSHKTVVVKYGGNAMTSDELKRAVALDLACLQSIGTNLVVVHGGGPDINQAMLRMGKKPAFVSGLRITDEETMEIVQMVLCGKVNKEIVSLVQSEGGKAVGLSGHDAGLIRARRRVPERVVDRATGEERLVDLGQVGDVEEISPAILHVLIRAGYIPVVSTVGVGEGGCAYNINADYAAAEIACALLADTLVMLTDVLGIFSDYGDESTLTKRTHSQGRPCHDVRRTGRRRHGPQGAIVHPRGGRRRSGRLTSSMDDFRTRSHSNCAHTRASAPAGVE